MADIRFEWLVEEIDEHGDIIEVHHLDSYAEARASAALVEGYTTAIGLVRDRGNELDGLLDRQWAYIEDGKLPERFSDSGGSEGPLVPARFHHELERY
jgi:hypothetical protein